MRSRSRAGTRRELADTVLAATIRGATRALGGVVCPRGSSERAERVIEDRNAAVGLSEAPAAPRASAAAGPCGRNRALAAGTVRSHFPIGDVTPPAGSATSFNGDLAKRPPSDREPSPGRGGASPNRYLLREVIAGGDGGRVCKATGRWITYPLNTKSVAVPGLIQTYQRSPLDNSTSIPTSIPSIPTRTLPVLAEALPEPLMPTQQIH